MNGSTISVYVDDMATPKITVNDSTFSRGQIGVRAHWSDSQFDNIIFTR